MVDIDLSRGCRFDDWSNTLDRKVHKENFQISGKFSARRYWVIGEKERKTESFAKNDTMSFFFFI